MLFLNASIEAARAGEMGKGFAVVARNFTISKGTEGTAETLSEEAERLKQPTS